MGELDLSTSSEKEGGIKLTRDVSDGEHSLHVRLLPLVGEDVSLLVGLNSQLLEAEILARRSSTNRPKELIDFEGGSGSVDGRLEGDRERRVGICSSDGGDVGVGVKVNSRLLEVRRLERSWRQRYSASVR